MATQKSYAIEFKNSVGAGIQYGGVVGWQGALKKGKSKGKIGLGILGVTFGYERELSNSWAVGASVSGIALFTGASVSINYYFSGMNRPGWSSGLDIVRSHRSTFFGNSEYYENHLLLSVGYHF